MTQSDGFILCEVMDMMIKYKKLVTENNYISKVYISCNYREIRGIGQ